MENDKSKMDEQNRCDLEMDLSQVNLNERPIGSWLCCLPCYWLERNSGFHKISLSVVTLLVTVLLVASPVLFLISSIPGDKSRNCAHQRGDCGGRENEKVCLTEECSNAGKRILASMSWESNPCEDFYRFACGSWEQEPENPERTQTKLQKEHLINFVTLQQQVDRSIQMFSLLEELGGYVEPKEKPPEDLTDLLLSLLRLNGAPLFDIYLDSDLDNSSKLAPYIDLPHRVGFNLAFRQRWHPSQNNVLVRSLPDSSSFFPESLSTLFSSGRKNGGGNSKAYNFIKASIEEKRLLVMEKIMKDFMPVNFSSAEKMNETQSTLHFASVITKLYPREKEIVKNYQGEPKTKMTAGELERKFPFIRWQYLLEKFLKFKTTSQDQIVVLSPDYMETLQRVLHRFPYRIIHNGLLLIFATDTLYELVNASSTRDRSAFCNKMTVRAFGEAVSVLYVNQYEEAHLEKLRSRVHDLFYTLKKSFEKRIEKISWLDVKTRAAVFEKLAALRIQFSSQPDYSNGSYARSLMQDVRVHPEDFFGNVIQRYRQLRNVPVDLKPDQLKEKRWAHPFVVNAFYILTLNTIIIENGTVEPPLQLLFDASCLRNATPTGQSDFPNPSKYIFKLIRGDGATNTNRNQYNFCRVIPLALLTQPYFGENVPLYIPYSTLGLIIAHEILHGFDLKGIGYDSTGTVGSLMSQESKAKFEARVDCFVKQFSSSFWRKVHFLGTNVDIQFDWNLTKNENMADISGLHMAYEAWKSQTRSGSETLLPGVTLNSHQLFFLNAAQTYCAMLSPADYIFLVEVDFHTPQPERVNGIMMNSPGFAEAYRCPLGSPMNPKRKCSTW